MADDTILALLVEQQTMLTRLDGRLERLGLGLERQDGRLERLGLGLERQDGRLEEVAARLGALEVRLDETAAGLSGRLDDLSGRLDGLSGRLDGVSTRLERLEAGHTRLRTDVMDRIDRLQDALTAQQEANAVPIGVAERAERMARTSQDLIASMSETLGILSRKVNRLEIDVQHLRNGH